MCKSAEPSLHDLHTVHICTIPPVAIKISKRSLRLVIGRHDCNGYACPCIVTIPLNLKIRFLLHHKVFLNHPTLASPPRSRTLDSTLLLSEPGFGPFFGIHFVMAAYGVDGKTRMYVNAHAVCCRISAQHTYQGWIQLIRQRGWGRGHTRADGRPRHTRTSASNTR